MRNIIVCKSVSSSFSVAFKSDYDFDKNDYFRGLKRVNNDFIVNLGDDFLIKRLTRNARSVFHGIDLIGDNKAYVDEQDQFRYHCDRGIYTYYFKVVDHQVDLIDDDDDRVELEKGDIIEYTPATVSSGAWVVVKRMVGKLHRSKEVKLEKYRKIQREKNQAEIDRRGEYNKKCGWHNPMPIGYPDELGNW